MLCNMNSTLLDYVPPPQQTHMGICFFFTLCLCLIACNSLVNCIMFEKNVCDMKCVLIFSRNFIRNFSQPKKNSVR